MYNNVYNEQSERRKTIESNKRKPKRMKKIKVQSNNVIIRYDLNNIHVDFD